MIVKVLLFAQSKDIIGANALELTLSDDADVGVLKQTLCEKYPGIIEVLNSSMISVDREYADDGRLLYHGAEVGIIPPVSGG